MILIGISGKKGVGKDLLASILAKKYGFVNFPFAEELKSAVRRDFNLTKEHTDGELKEGNTQYIKNILPPDAGPEDTVLATMWTPREIMIKYGQFFRQFDPNWWVNKTFDKINAIPCFISNNSLLRITISDVRFKNEADYIKSQGGILVRLNRPIDLNIYKTVSTDISETDLDNYKGFDLVLPQEYNIDPTDLDSFADAVMTYVEVKDKC
jgi:hypothetical protein